MRKNRKASRIGKNPLSATRERAESPLVPGAAPVLGYASTLVATQIQARLRYLEEEDEVVLFADPDESRFGRVQMPHSLSRNTAAARRGPAKIAILRQDAFVQPGVNQTFSLITALPAGARFLLVYAEFSYATSAALLQRVVLRISRLLGLTQFTLAGIRAPHTAERLFRLGAEGETPPAGSGD